MVAIFLIYGDENILISYSNSEFIVFKINVFMFL